MAENDEILGPTTSEIDFLFMNEPIRIITPGVTLSYTVNIETPSNEYRWYIMNEIESTNQYISANTSVFTYTFNKKGIWKIYIMTLDNKHRSANIIVKVKDESELINSLKINNQIVEKIQISNKKIKDIKNLDNNKFLYINQYEGLETSFVLRNIVNFESFKNNIPSVSFLSIIPGISFGYETFEEVDNALYQYKNISTFEKVINNCGGYNTQNINDIINTNGIKNQESNNKWRLFDNYQTYDFLAYVFVTDYGEYYGPFFLYNESNNKVLMLDYKIIMGVNGNETNILWIIPDDWESKIQ